MQPFAREPGARFSKVPVSCSVFIQNGGFKVFSIMQLNQQLKKVNGLVRILEPASLFFNFWFETMASGPLNYRDDYLLRKCIENSLDNMHTDVSG